MQTSAAPSRAERRAAYKAEWARKNAKRVRANQSTYYLDHSEELKAASRALHQAKRPHVTHDELARLQKPENRMEALNYGPERKQQVCLNCGGMFGGNFSRHPSACPVKHQPSDGYREQWGYNKTNPLTSSEWRTRKSKTLKNSQKFQAARKADDLRWSAVREKQVATLAEAKKEGKPIRRGPLRAETVSGRRGRRLPPRPNRQKVSDEAILRIMALDLPISEGAKRAKLSQTAYYRRAQKLGQNFDLVKERRRVVNRYLFELRRWLWQQQQLPLAQVILDHHVGETRKGSSLYCHFSPFLEHLKAELVERPDLIQQLASRQKGVAGGLLSNAAVLALAGRVFKRARRTIQGIGTRPAGRKRVGVQNLERSQVFQSVRQNLQRFESGMKALTRIKARTDDEDLWRKELFAMRYTADEVKALTRSRTAKAAAQRFVAQVKGWKLHSVQSACSEFWQK